MKRRMILLAALAVVSGYEVCAQTISLAGKWRFQLDRLDAGIKENWFTNKLAGTLRLPGSLPEQGIGDAISLNTTWTGTIVDRSWFTAPEYAQYRQPRNIKVPFWLQPEKYYAGVAWFQRELEIPRDWEGRRVVLTLERPHWETRVWLDERLIGTNVSLSTPHEYDLGQIAPGLHRLTVRVSNQKIVDIGEDSHAISDHTQGNWNGIVGAITLHATPLLWINDVQVFPDCSNHTARVTVAIGNQTSRTQQVQVALFPEAYLNVTSAPPIFAPATEAEVPPGGATIQAEFSFGEVFYSWDEFAPHLYSLGVRIQPSNDGTLSDSRTVSFGIRDVRAEGTQFTVNGRKTFFRGTLECCIFPKTGNPPTEVGEWKRIMGVAKSYGLNLFRFHSYCPPEAAFEAADQLGLYLQVETCWANGSTSLGDGRPVDQWVFDETARILKAYGNHPSFILMPYGNEPGGKKVNPYLTRYVSHFKALDPRRLWTSGSGWPELPENQFEVNPEPRIQHWGEGLRSRVNSRPPETTTDYRNYISERNVPVISHEIGQWCVYPNFGEIPKYTGYLKPKNFEIFRDRLQANGLGGLARRFLMASGKLQALCYKEDIESALRTPGMGGFELLDLHDFPGQGTALVGVVDPFWQEKGYTDAAQYRRFCNATVPLARLGKRVFAQDENLVAQIEVAHYGASESRRALAKWKLVESGGRVVRQGELPARDLAPGTLAALGDLSVPLREVQAPRQCRLVVGIGNDAREYVENDWDLWVYPGEVRKESGDVLVTPVLDEAARRRLALGGKVLLSIPGAQVRNYDKQPVIVGFSSIFWNTAWTERQPPTTLGILCNPKHPALAGFPTESHSNWQWWYLVHRAGALRLDLLPKGIGPVVRVIDDWVTARPLALIVEAKVGPGRIVVCGFDLTGQDASDPVSRQMRTSLVAYMNSKSFRPRIGCSMEQIRSLTANSIK